MREIKFRAWSIVGKRMYDWEEMHAYPAHKLSQYFRYNDMYVIMQYTGLKDRNDKEIYEGDIVDWYGERMVIAWDTTFAGWQMQTPSGLGSMRFHAGDAEGVKVIGNVHENPELLDK